MCKINVSESARLEMAANSKVNAGDVAVMPEPTGDLQTLAIGSDASSVVLLKRGSYRIQGEMENYDLAKLEINKSIAIPVDGEFKRIFIHKLDVQKPTKGADGSQKSRFTAVITVIDNPVPIIPIIYGVSIIGSLTAGWFFVDKVQKFGDTFTGRTITFLTVVVLLFGVYKFFRP
jgi:hypothetical protein